MTFRGSIKKGNCILYINLLAFSHWIDLHFLVRELAHQLLKLFPSTMFPSNKWTLRDLISDDSVFVFRWLEIQLKDTWNDHSFQEIIKIALRLFFNNIKKKHVFCVFKFGRAISVNLASQFGSKRCKHNHNFYLLESMF